MNCDLCILLSYMLRMLCQYDSKLAEQPGNKGLVTADQRSLLTLQKTTTKARQNYKWSYEGQTGPDHWHKNFPQCGGKRQSPINIMTSHLHHVTWLPQFEFINYDKLSGDGMTPAFLHLRNNGHTASMAIDDDVYLRGSNLGELYRAVEIHFHWGPDNRVGSEHVLDSQRHPLEVHIVHYNTKYKTLSHAKQQPDGLAVLGVFADISEEKNHAFELIAMALDQVTEYNQKTIVTGLRPIEMLPNDTSKYYHYAGSLTTPPCYESVSWYIMHEGITITQDQINRLRHLKEHVDENHAPHKPQPSSRSVLVELKVNITHNNSVHALSNPDHHKDTANQYIRYNFRPCQPLYERQVYCSHPSMVRHTSYFPEFSVGDIAVNHHVSNLGDHDLSKDLLQDTGSGFHHAIGSSLSNHPHDGHSPRSTLNIHSHENDHQPRKMEIEFNGRNLKKQRITDAFSGHPDKFLKKTLPKDLKVILKRNHIPDFEHKLEQKDIYKIFGNIFLRQAQILSVQKTMDKSSKIDTKLFAEPIKEYSNPIYKVSKIQHITKHNIHSKNESQRQERENSSNHGAFKPQEHVAPKPIDGDLSKNSNSNKDAIKHHRQEAPKSIKNIDNTVNPPTKERLPDYKTMDRKKKSGLPFNLSSDRLSYSVRKRNKLMNGGFHFSVRKPTYQQHSGEITRNFQSSTLTKKRKSSKFISKPYTRHYRGSMSVEKSKTKKVEVPHKISENGIIDLISDNGFGAIESETTLKTTKALVAFVTSTPKVSSSPGFGNKLAPSVFLETLGLEKQAPYGETANDGLSNLKTETVPEIERASQSTPYVHTAPLSTSTTVSPEIVTSEIPPESYKPVQTKLESENVRFPIQRERNATSIPIRNMLDGYNNMLSMLTNPPPSNDKKPYLPL